LEGGLISRYEQDILKKTNFYEPQNVNIPILAIYAPHPAISPHHIFHLDYSDRYFAHFPEMSEFHVLNYGIFEKYVPNIIGEPKGNTLSGFKTTSELVLHFLNSTLKSDPEELEQIFTDKSDSYRSDIDTLFVLRGYNAPPNITQLKDMFNRRGMVSINNVYQLHISEGNPKPFSQSFYSNFKNWLAWKKDPDFIHRKQLYEMAVQSFPSSAESHFYLAYYNNKTGNKDEALVLYRRSLILLESDTELEEERKEVIRGYIMEDLNQF